MEDIKKFTKQSEYFNTELYVRGKTLYFSGYVLSKLSAKLVSDTVQFDTADDKVQIAAKIDCDPELFNIVLNIIDNDLKAAGNITEELIKFCEKNIQDKKLNEFLYSQYADFYDKYFDSYTSDLAELYAKIGHSSELFKRFTGYSVIRNNPADFTAFVDSLKDLTGNEAIYSELSSEQMQWVYLCKRPDTIDLYFFIKSDNFTEIFPDLFDHVTIMKELAEHSEDSEDEDYFEDDSSNDSSDDNPNDNSSTEYKTPEKDEEKFPHDELHENADKKSEITRKDIIKMLDACNSSSTEDECNLQNEKHFGEMAAEIIARFLDKLEKYGSEE